VPHRKGARLTGAARVRPVACDDVFVALAALRIELVIADLLERVRTYPWSLARGTKR